MTLQTLINNSTFSVHLANETHRADIFSHLRAALVKLTASAIPPQVFCDRNWQNIQLAPELPAVALAPRHVFMDLPPAHGNALAVDVAFVARPLEWGISGPQPEADLSVETQVFAFGPNENGLFTHVNSARFDEAVSGNEPYKFVPAGSAVIQTGLCIAGAAAAGVDDLVIWEAHCLVQKGKTNFQPAFRVSPAPGELMPGTAMVVPNTIRTFRHRDMHVCAPALVSPAVPLQLLILISNHRGPVTYGGLIVQRILPHLQNAPLIVGSTYEQKALSGKAKKAAAAAQKAKASSSGKGKDAPSA